MSTEGLTPAQRVRTVYELMKEHKVSLADLELFGHIEDIAGTDPEDCDLLYTVDETFDRVHGEIDLNEGNAVEHYWQATADYVRQRLDDERLLWGDPDGEPGVPCLTDGCGFTAHSTDEMRDHKWEKHAIRASH